MNCQAFHQTFSDYLDGVLDAADAVRVRRHLEACKSCRRIEAAYRAGVAALRDAEGLCPPRELSVRILHRVRRERRLPALSGAYGVAGTLLLATLVAAVAFDLKELEEAAPSGEPLVAQATPAPPPTATGRFDHITVRLRDVSEMLLGDPYALISAIEPDPPLRIRVEVPAVWSGR